MPQPPHMRLHFFKRMILIIISVLIFLLVTIIVLFNYYKDDIGREVVLHVNKVQTGELAFEDISVNPFVHFPSVSLALKGVNYFEHPLDQRLVDSIPIIELEKLFVAFNILDLIKGDLTASKILLKNGRVTLITYADSSLNIANAFNIKPDTLQQYRDTITDKSLDFELNLEKVVLENIDIAYDDLLNKNYSAYSINSLDASLNYLPDTIKCKVESNIGIDEAKLINSLRLSNKSINVATSLIFHRNTQKIVIEPSSFSFESANFALEGYIDLLNDGYIDLTVKGGDKDFSILNLFLKSTVVENIDEGDLFFNATVVGMLKKGIPQIECSFGITDVKIQIPNTNKSISKLSLTGFFQSGNKKNYSEAQLKLTEISAQLPGGNLDGNFSVVNFLAPLYDFQYKMKTDLVGFENIINLSSLDSLSGNVEIVGSFRGKYDPVKKQFIEKKGNSTIRCDSISFVIPGVTQIHDVEGVVRFDTDSLIFKDFGLEIGTSDFHINGSLANISYLLFGVEKNIEGDLHIISNTYDFPDFFSYDQNTARSFPYRIEDVNLNVGISTSTGNLLDFTIVPDIDFNIQHLDAEIEDFLPPVVINSGMFNLGEIDSSLNLNFADFHINMAGSSLKANVVYNSPRINPDWLTVDLNASELNPQATFIHWVNDSISNDLNGELDGSIHLDLVLSTDTNDFDNLNFTADQIVFINSTDTFGLQQLKLNAVDVDYDLTASNIMENLNCEIGLIINNIYTKNLKVDKLNYDIKVEKGTYFIRPINSQFFNRIGEGLYVLKPFGEKPEFDIKYKVKQFDVEELFDTFLEDTLITGKMDLDLAFTCAGSDKMEIEQTLNGRLLISGKDLTLYGLDLDKVIDRFKRSQHFTFADLGAVMLMGPAGILLTKGTDYASIIVLNHGESSKVVELSSDWEVENGMVNLADVAFTTNKNRMAGKGWINLMTDSLNIEIALLNNKGCSQYSQSIKGYINKPDRKSVV